MGEIVVNDEHVPARFHEMLRNAGRGIGGDIGKPGRVVAFGHDDDGVIHGAFLAQVGDDFGDGGRALADGAIDAQHILVALVQNGVDRNGGLAGLPVAEDQFALAAADRNQRIDDDEAGLQRHGDGRTVHDRPRGAFDGQTPAGRDRPFAIERRAQRVDDAPDQPIAHRHVHHPARALDLIARVQMPAIAKQHDADFVLIDVERDAVQIAGKLHQFIKAHARKARDLGDADGDARDRAHFTRRQLRRESLQRPADARERLVEGRTAGYQSECSMVRLWGRPARYRHGNNFRVRLVCRLSPPAWALRPAWGRAWHLREEVRRRSFPASRDNPRCSRPPSVRWRRVRCR